MASAASAPGAGLAQARCVTNGFVQCKLLLHGLLGLSRAGIPVMSRDLVCEKYVLNLWTSANIVNYQRTKVTCRILVNDYSDMRKIAGQHPCYQVTRVIFSRDLRDWPCCALPFKKHLKVRNSAMVNVWVWCSETPYSRILIETSHHIVVNQPLQIHADGSVRPDNYVRTNPDVGGNISVRIVQCEITAVINNLMVCALDSRFGESLRNAFRRVLRGGYTGTQNHCDQQMKDPHYISGPYAAVLARP